MDPGDGEQRGRVQVLTGRPVLATGEGGHCLVRQFPGAAQPASQGLRQRKMPQAAGSFVVIARGGGSGHPRPQRAGRLVEASRPYLYGATVGQHLGLDPGSLSELAVRHVGQQRLGAGGGRRRGGQIPATAGRGEPDQCGGQPARGPLIGGSAAQGSFRGGQRGGDGLWPRVDQRHRR
jgi:hypothetical protein